MIDSVTIPYEIIEGRDFLTFSLNRNLVPESSDRSIEINKVLTGNAASNFYHYKIKVNNNGQEDLVIPIKYSGSITEKIKTGAAEYARGFSETDGIISDAGVFLAGSTFWIPLFEEPLLTFNLTVTLRSDWNVVSQGKRTTNEVTDDIRTVTYNSQNPTEEVYLISAAWTEYEQKAGQVLVQAFLRTPDQELADRYLNATSGYLNMYVDLIGPYPYTKFALVENFWETGFGMPSFTLLGEKIIRFPWILNTSYPHELLHNWWGNSVYVDFDKGNWCEGITSYMADHFLKEQNGLGASYRRTSLQKFTDYVNSENDFPVIDFRSRNNAAEEAIGYGKCLMFNHMLRRITGDEKFIKAYQSFYNDNIYKISTFDNIQESFQGFSENDLKPFFDQWLMRKGAPSLELSDVRVEKAGDGFDLFFVLSQTQEEEEFFLDVPVAVYLENSVELMDVVSDKRINSYSFHVPTKPVKIEIDPQFDVFRRLDKREVPPSLSQIFGSSDALIILPKNSPLLLEYTALAEAWKQTQEAQGKSLRITLDEDLDQIPDNTCAWIIGYENKFTTKFDIQKDYHEAFDAGQTELFHTLASEGSLVYTIPNPENNAITIGFLGTNVKQSVPGLTRLLTHYGKYSFRGFEGERPTNVLKGTFPAIDSPLFYSIPYNGQYLGTTAELEPTKALIE
ncbi:MAG: hypothetical protein K8R53_03820 [Bacteroidales bacterium]|nr:hypothetical protein [Bacteroidales bacterium]